MNNSDASVDTQSCSPERPWMLFSKPMDQWSLGWHKFDQWVGQLHVASKGVLGVQDDYSTEPMLSLVQQCAAFLRKWRVDGGAKKHPEPVVCALSGGADSCALLYALVAYERMYPSRIKVHAVHVNHQLQTCAQDFESFCIQMCSHLGVPLHTARVQVPQGGRKKIEAEARTVRREALRSYAQKVGASWVFLGNHADDWIEGHLINWVRGSGLSGLAGFEPVGRLEEHNMHSVVGESEKPWVHSARPWMYLSKGQLCAALECLQLPWVQDPTNAQDLYERSALRGCLAQHWDQARPGWRKGAVRSMQQLAQDRDLLRWCRSDLCERYVKSSSHKDPNAAPWMLPLHPIKELPTSVLRALLHEFALRSYGQALNSGHIDQMVSALSCNDWARVQVSVPGMIFKVKDKALQGFYQESSTIKTATGSVQKEPSNDKSMPSP